MRQRYDQGPDDYPLFSLIHGRRLSKAYWEPFQEELRERGVRSIAHNLPVSSGFFNLEEHAQFIYSAEYETGAEQIVRFGHSWGGNPAVRAVSKQIVEIDFVASVFHPLSVPPSRKILLPSAGEDHSMTYKMMGEDDRLLEDKELRRWAFFNGVIDEYVELYDDFRPHPKIDLEPGLERRAEAPMRYFVTFEDRIVPPPSQVKHATAMNVDQIISSESLVGHMPMLSSVEELADLLLAPWVSTT